MSFYEKCLASFKVALVTCREILCENFYEISLINNYSKSHRVYALIDRAKPYYNCRDALSPSED